LNTIGPFPNTSSRNNYIIVAIEHYSKCCEAKRVLDHIGVIVTKFLIGEMCGFLVKLSTLMPNGASLNL